MDVVDENEERMPDIPLHPRILAEREEQKRQEQERVVRAEKAAQRKAAAASARDPRTTGKPQTHAPHVSTAQRRRNQADQPRDRDGKYGRRPMERLRTFLSHEPPPKTSLKRVPWSHPTGGSGGRARPKSVAKKKTRALPSVQRMMDRPLHEKVVWVVRRWVRRKKKHLRALFSWKG